MQRESFNNGRRLPLVPFRLPDRLESFYEMEYINGDIGENGSSSVAAAAAWGLVEMLVLLLQDERDHSISLVHHRPLPIPSVPLEVGELRGVKWRIRHNTNVIPKERPPRPIVKSVSKRGRHENGTSVLVQTSPGLTPLVPSSTEATCRFKTLRGALRVALGLVLDNSYRNRGGYKLSPAELRIHAAAATAQSAASHAVASGGSEKENSPELELEPPSPEKTFQQRKRRLLALLGEDNVSKAAVSSRLGTTIAASSSCDGTRSFVSWRRCRVCDWPSIYDSANCRSIVGSGTSKYFVLYCLIIR